MTREEMISKLSGINACAANITYTYDVGLLFDVLSSKGVHSVRGYNIGQWPCYKLYVSEETNRLVYRLKKGESIAEGELLVNSTIRELCTYHTYVNSWLVDGDTLAKCVNLIKDGLKKIEDVQDTLFAYVSLEEWNICVAFFLTYEELQDFFMDKYNNDRRSWEEMSDAELKEWYQIAEENDWEGIPYMEIGDNI